MSEGFGSIIMELEQRKNAIDKALFALRNIDGMDDAPDWVTTTKPAKMKLEVSAPASDGTGKVSPLKGRTVSAETRARMIEGQKRRYAAKG
jgi:hypothetical protein